MIYESDIQHIKAIAVRFGNLNCLKRKTESAHKQIIRLGSALQFVREWYDLHNRNRVYHRVWKECLDVLKTYSITPNMIGKIVVDSENSLTYRQGRVRKAEELSIQLSSFVNPIMYDKESFINEMTKHTHPTLQQSVGCLLFTLIASWGTMRNPEFYDPRNDQLRGRCKEISDIMKERYGSDWYELMVV